MSITKNKQEELAYLILDSNNYFSIKKIRNMITGNKELLNNLSLPVKDSVEKAIRELDLLEFSLYNGNHPAGQLW